MIYNILDFSKKCLNIELTQKQEDVLSNADNTLSKSEGKFIILIIKALYESIINMNYNIVLLSPNLIMSQCLYNITREIIDKSDIRDFVERNVENKIHFTSGSTIRFVYNFRQLHGVTVDITLCDEEEMFVGTTDYSTLKYLKRFSKIYWNC